MKGDIEMPGARILLVEDDEVLGDLMGRNLTMRQHEVSIAADARSALARLQANSFDLILLDINLPDQTGWNVLRCAQQCKYLQPLASQRAGEHEVLPVVVLSAVRVSPRRLAEFHPLAYLPKPFPMEAVLRLASEAAQRRQDSTHVHRTNTTDGQQPHPSSESLLMTPTDCCPSSAQTSCKEAQRRTINYHA
jgi:DNA-binding response OmpR family regulator